MEVQVYIFLRKPAEKGVVDRLRFAVCAVRVVCVAHYMAFGVAHVAEGLLFVNANDSALLVCQEVFAVGIEVAQKPVRDVLALDLRRHLRRKVGSRAKLPGFKVDSSGGGLYLLLESSRLLRIGPERLILPALALGRLKKPLPAVGVGVIVHLASVAQVDGAV